MLWTTLSVRAELPAWIWRAENGRPVPAGERGFLRKKFTVIGKVERALLEAACGAAMEVKFNGKLVGKSAEIKQPIKQEVTALLQGGENLLSVAGRTAADFQGLLVQLELQLEYGKTQTVLSDGSWKFSLDNPAGWETLGFDDGAWASVREIGKLGDAPWGAVFAAKGPVATPASEITVPDGFKIELLRSAGSREGSWVCMAVDPKGRLYISPQEAIPESGFSKDSAWGGIWRGTLGQAGEIVKWEKVPVPIGGCMGMCWAFDSLYLSGQGPEGQAIYRCRDLNDDDVVESWKLFKKVPGGGGEHGAHAIVLGPDQHLYIMQGNATPLVEGLAADSPAHHYAEEDLLPRIKDPVATFFDHVKSPYGHVLRTDEHGEKWELLCTGMRNAYDFDFDDGGRLFTFDSDMEWDLGMPWYRPTRILRIVPGADYGFREGSAKIPESAYDTLGSTCRIGLASPTGVKFAHRSNWPMPFRACLFVMDWTYGRILAVDGEEMEPFLQGRGLPVTDLEFGLDGAMYFCTGGRGTAGGLYRVSTLNPVKMEEPSHQVDWTWEALTEGKSEAELEQRLQHSKRSLWMASESAEGDVVHRSIVEREPLAKWAQGGAELARWIQAKSGLLAVARAGGPADREKVADEIIRLRGEMLADYAEWAPDIQESLAEDDLAEFRLWQILCSRAGKDAAGLRRKALSFLKPRFPTHVPALNRELAQLLAMLEWPELVGPTLKLLRQAQTAWEKASKPAPNPLEQGPQEDQIWYARVLCEVPAAHFTAEQRGEYFRWFDEIVPQLKGGNNFAKYLEVMRQRALAKLAPEIKAAVEQAHQQALVIFSAQQHAPKIAAPLRTFQKMYAVNDLEGEVGRVKAGRNFARGEEFYHSLLCAKCHLMNGQGGNVGPDLSGLGGRFAVKDMLEAMIDPSKVVSDQYAATLVQTKTETLFGLIAAETPEALTMYADPFGLTKQTVLKRDIKQRGVSKTSLMPPALLNSLTVEEICDLLAFLQSGGKAEAANFQPTP